MGIFGNKCKVDIITQLHVLGVDSEDLHSSDLIWYTNIDFSIKSTKSSESWINTVRSVSSTNAHNLSSALDTVHEGKKLSDNSSLDLTIGLLSVWSDGINLIDEDDSGLVCFGLSEGLSEVLLGLTSHF